MATTAASAAPTRTSTKITTVANLAADYTPATPTEVTASMSTQVIPTVSVASGLPLGMPSLRLPHHLPLLGGIDYATKNVGTVAQPTATNVSATPPGEFNPRYSPHFSLSKCLSKSKHDALYQIP